jgi:DNA-binding NtrC family response regulator
MNQDLVKNAMSQWAMEVISCSTLQEARALLPDPTLSLIFCEETLRDGTYSDVLNILGRPLKTRMVVISPSSHVDEKYQEAIGTGAFDVIASPCRPSDVQWMVIRAIREESRHVGRRGRAQA